MRSSLIKTRISFFLIGLAVIAALIWLSAHFTRPQFFPRPARAAFVADQNLRGWAFSGGIGWISFSSFNCDTNKNGIMDIGDSPPANCPSVGTSIPLYGAHINFFTGILS